ncbi:MAG: M24 family metallopeptidase C-terminal domain-containing protein [Lachnospira pectinoschiza]
MDYRCGTGHGIGYLLNVHESPNGFRWKHNPGKNDLAVIEEGMVTSDEPGVYIEGRFGIRIENEIVCQKDFDNEYGTFLKFDMLTVVPIDLELVDVNYLDDVDIERLNKYQERVYKTLESYFDGEKRYVKEATRPVDMIWVKEFSHKGEAIEKEIKKEFQLWDGQLRKRRVGLDYCSGWSDSGNCSCTFYPFTAV